MTHARDMHPGAAADVGGKDSVCRGKSVDASVLTAEQTVGINQIKFIKSNLRGPNRCSCTLF